MLLSRLARTLSDHCTLAPPGTASADGDPELRRACFDSRRVQPGDLFCALPGEHTDGRRHVADAVDRGAAAVLSVGGLEGLAVPELRVQLGHRPAEVAGRAAAWLRGRPSAELLVAAVTGTNGKSTVVHLLQQAWESAGIAAARIGTLGFAHRGGAVDAANTTPTADLLHGWLAEAVAAGARAVAVEASSHGLDQDRLAGLEVDVAAWTNLSHDHLDYHRDLDAYAAAKARLFAMLPAGAPAFVPADDARVLGAVRGSRAALHTWRLTPAGADARSAAAREGRSAAAREARSAAALEGRLLAASGGERGGVELEIGGLFGGGRLSSPLVGAHNAENLLVAFGLLRASGVGVDEALAGLASAAPAPGRLQRVAPDAPWRLFVDYAHTPDAVVNALQALRAAYPGARLGVVLGAGGDRDPAKRAPMGAAAARGADWCMFTSDNPRTEDPDAILAQVVAGARAAATDPATVEAEVDRRIAIRAALQRLRPGDVLLVAGKGHETYQEIHGVRHPFDDRIELEEAARCCS